MTTAIGYCRVSTDQQGDSGAGLEAQQAAIRAEVEHRGWEFGGFHVDVASGGSTKRRPEYATALLELAAGHAQVLVVAKLDRLSRSLADFANLMVLSQQEGWSITALDIGVDTSTINGELVANIIMALAQWERRVIGQRTKDALGAIQARGVKLGRPRGVSDDTETFIRVLRTSGKSFRGIAQLLNAESVPTGQGGDRWHPSTVKAVLERKRSTMP